MYKRNFGFVVNEILDLDPHQYDTEREATMKNWREEFHAVLDKYDLNPSRVYNGNQTGLYYQKLPYRMYVNAK